MNTAARSSLSSPKLRLALLLAASAMGCTPTGAYQGFDSPRVAAASDASSSHTCREVFDAEAVTKYVRRAVVRISDESGNSGTGFIAASPNTGTTYMVTNHHVVRSGNQFRAQVEMSDGQLFEFNNVQVLKYDAVRDLALMALPNFVGLHEGLHFDLGAPRLGARVAAFGYPSMGGHAGEPQLTYEPGDVTADPRKFQDGLTYITTNANINAGNSGGPVVDSCGRVVGIVVARMHDVERVGLVIPAAGAAELVSDYENPSISYEQAAVARVRELLSAVIYDQTLVAAGTFSQAFMDSYVVPYIDESAQAAMTKYAKILTAHGMLTRDANNLSFEQHLELMGQVLTPDEYRMTLLAVSVQYGVMTRFEAAQQEMANMIQLVLAPDQQTGWKLDNYEIERLSIDDDFGQAYVRLDWAYPNDAPGRSNHWILFLNYRWGTWEVDGLDKI